MQVELVETVEVESGDSYAVIRKVDYDPETHVLYDEALKQRAAKADADAKAAEAEAREKADADAKAKADADAKAKAPSSPEPAPLGAGEPSSPSGPATGDPGQASTPDSVANDEGKGKSKKAK